MKKFLTPYDRPVFEGEKSEGVSLTERFGYVPLKDQIERLMISGETLLRIRALNYDFSPGEDVPKDFFDLTREPNFDFVDYYRVALEFNARLDAQREARLNEAALAAQSLKAEEKAVPSLEDEGK